MYNNSDIQKMIDEVKVGNRSQMGIAFPIALANSNLCLADKRAIKNVIENEPYTKAFDRYDSDVCEQFITLYEKAKGMIKGV